MIPGGATFFTPKNGAPTFVDDTLGEQPGHMGLRPCLAASGSNQAGPGEESDSRTGDSLSAPLSGKQLAHGTDSGPVPPNLFIPHMPNLTTTRPR